MAVLFSDLSRSSALARRLDAEQMADLLDQFRNACRRTVQAHGGQVARVQGDGMLATFGYPDAVDGAAARALEAAFDLAAAVSRLSIDDLPADFRPLGVHSGVHAGLVLVVEGDIERGRFDLVGEVPNSVERLSKAAGTGEVCVSAEAIGPDLPSYVVAEALSVPTSPGEPMLPSYRLTARQPAAERFGARHRPGLSRFVGRASELRSLSVIASEAGVHRPRCATISGGPGMGKSRLIFELLRQPAWASVRVLRGYCDDYGGAEALQPFMQVVRSLLVGVSADQDGPDVVEQLDPAHQLALRQALVRDVESAASAATLAPAVVALVGAIAERRRTALVLDDWQWADDASRQLLAAVLSMDVPLNVILASRERDVHRSATLDSPQIDLEPLALDDLGAALAELLPGADPFLARQIHRQAGGVPLYIEELCHAVRAGRVIEALPERAGSTAWLDLLVESRLGRLPAEVADALRVCSVLGAAFPRWLMGALIPGSAVEAILGQAVQADFLSIRADGTIQFKHQLTRDAVYGTIGRQRRRDWHARALAYLRQRESDGDWDTVESLAFHAAGAGRVRDQALFGEQAGDKAMAVFALDRARSHFLSVLKALEKMGLAGGDAESWCRVAAKLGMAAVFDPLALSDGVLLFEKAVEVARTLDDPGMLARAEYWLGYVCYAKGFPRRSLAHCGRAAGLATQAGDVRLLAQVEATLGQALVSAGRYGEALPRLDGALGSKRLHARPGSGIAIGSAYTLACKGLLLGDRGRSEEAHACFAHAMGLLGDTGHPVASSVRGWVATVLLWEQRWADAARVAREGELIADRAGTRHLLAMSRALGGYAAWRLGEGIGAWERVREATNWIEQRHGAFTLSLNYGWLLDMSVSLGQDADTLRRLAACLVARARHGDRLGEAMGRRALARCALAQGRYADAELALKQAERCARVRCSPHEVRANRALHEHLSRTTTAS